MKLVWALSVSILLGACSSFQREPAAAVLSETSPLPTLQKSLLMVESENFNKNTCGAILTEITQHYRNTPWAQYSNQELISMAKSSIQTSWNLRLAIHQKLDVNGPACALIARDLFHEARDFEDYMGDFAYAPPALMPEQLNFQTQPVPILDRASYTPYLVRPDLDQPRFQFHPGDLMLARGISFLSATISQVSDNRAHFSHMVFMAPDPKTKAMGTVESYIGVGVKPYELNFALKNENARLLVLRPKNRALGAEAARIAAQAARSNIPYDYAFDFKDYSKMTCVEVAVYSYDKASKGQLHIPSLPAKINVHNPKFLSQMNIADGEMITPDDLEVDPNFELVLEWRDSRLIRDSRQKDALLSEMMRWVGDLHYNFHDSLMSFAAKNVVYPARRTPLWPLVQKLAKAPDLDPRLPRKTLGLMKVLTEVGDVLLKEIRAQDAAHFEKYQRSMTNQELRDALEKYRQQDLKLFEEEGKSPLHTYLRAG